MVQFPVTNPTVGGGTALFDILMQMLGPMSQQALGRAGVAQDLFGQLLAAQTEARRRPISLVDQLMLMGEVGNIFPFSQAGQERLSRYMTPPRTNLLRTLMDRLDIFSRGALTGPEHVEERIRGSPAFAEAFFRQMPKEAQEESLRAPRFQFGGSLVVDPRQRKTRGRTIAGPVSIFDRSGKRVGVGGEAGREAVEFRPLPIGVRPPTAPIPTPSRSRPELPIGERPPTAPMPTLPRPGPIGVRPPEQPMPKLARPQPDVVLTRDEQARFDWITEQNPDIPLQHRIGYARNPAAWEGALGGETDPRQAAARALAAGLQGDPRFGDPLISSLALGRAPAPGMDINMRELGLLSPDLLGQLASVIGPDMLDQWMFELAGYTPTGTGTRGAVRGGVRFAA